MNFLKKLFGGTDSGKSSRDPEGLFLYVQCDNCGDKVRLHIYKQQELNRGDSGFVWHKTIIDNRCFRPIPTVVNFDSGYRVVSADIEGGHYITREEYETAKVSQDTDDGVKSP